MNKKSMVLVETDQKDTVVTHSFEVTLKFSGKVTDIAQVEKNILYALYNGMDGQGLAPENEEAVTVGITVEHKSKPTWYCK